MSGHSEGSVALVTGATGGLGVAVVDALVEAGWRVVAAGHQRFPDRAGDRVWSTRLDVTDGPAVRRLVEEVTGSWGHVDLLVTAAGVLADGSLADLSEEAWDRVLDVNLKGAFLCGQAVLTPMVARGQGQVIFVGSHGGRTGVRGQTNYAAAKAGLIGMALSMAREVGSAGVCVNVILPGVMNTPMTADLRPERMAALTEASVLGRVNSPVDVARSVVWLASTRHVSGQVLVLDGRVLRWT